MASGDRLFVVAGDIEPVSSALGTATSSEALDFEYLIGIAVSDIDRQAVADLQQLIATATAGHSRVSVIDATPTS